MNNLETKTIAVIGGLGLALTGASGVELYRSLSVKERVIYPRTGLKLSQSMIDMGFTNDMLGENAVFADHVAGLNSDKLSYRHCTMIIRKDERSNQVDFYEAPSMDRWNITSENIQSVVVVISDSNKMDGKAIIVPLAKIEKYDDAGNITESFYRGVTGSRVDNRTLIFRVTDLSGQTHAVPTVT